MIKKIVMLFLACLVFFANTLAAAAAPGIAEINAAWLELQPVYTGEKYTEAPITTAPYAAGRLTGGYLQDGLNMANFVRYLAGVPADLVLDSGLCEQAQYGAVLEAAHVAATGQLSHTPPKPADMDQTFYNTGYAATSSSNIYGGSRSLPYVVQAFMDDSDPGNIAALGHRRWILNPQMQKTGFGCASLCSLMPVFDKSRTSQFDYDYVAWPSPGYFPTDFHAADTAWSVSLNPDKFDNTALSGIRVILTRVADGAVWELDSTDTNVYGQYFTVNTSGYGTRFCIIFRPDNIAQFQSGDRYNVNIIGLKAKNGADTAVSYAVEFFGLGQAVTLRSIAITTSASKLIYEVGEPLDISGLQVTGTYSDNSTRLETVNLTNVSGFDSSVPAVDQVLTITVGGINTTYKVQIVNGQAIRDFVARFYSLCLSRQPDQGGLDYWVGQLAGGQQTGANVAQNFIFSNEFLAQNVSDSAFLDIMYSAFFDRAADDGGKTYWQGQIDSGMSRLFILASFVNSAEFTGVCNNYGITRGSVTLTDPADFSPQVTAFVNRFYVLCMDRQPDSSGLNYWVDQLVSGYQTGADISQGFMFSPEFTAKDLNNTDFVTVLYRVFFNREPDTGGQAFWVGELDAGASRSQVLAGFVGSSEFAALCNSIGIPVGVVLY